MIVYTPKKKHRRGEYPIDRERIEMAGIACPVCGKSSRLTGGKVTTMDRRIIYCGLCDNSFWEDEGLRL